VATVSLIASLVLFTLAPFHVRPGDAGGATDGPAQILGWGDYLQLEFDTATKRGHGAPQPAGVSAESAHRTWEHRGQKRVTRLQRSLLIGTMAR
jgi:hypothetical protein